MEKTRRQKQMKLREYTQEGYKRINSTLRKNKNYQIESELEQLNQELSQCPHHSGTVYRGLVMDKSEISDLFIPGKIYRDFAFMSTSITHVESQRFNVVHLPLSRTDNRSVTLTISSKTGRYIGKDSQYAEQEVLFPPLTKFKVISVRKDDWEEYFIELEEV
ncbi:MAG: ADP-ribosyltransferase [Dolichospermum sp.]